MAFDDPLTLGYPGQVVALAAKHRLPVIYGFREFPEVGGLMSYGANRPRLVPASTTVFVDKILKGAKPADLPVEQPTKFEFIIQSENRQADRLDDSTERAGESGQGHPMTVLSTE